MLDETTARRLVDARYEPHVIAHRFQILGPILNEYMKRRRGLPGVDIPAAILVLQQSLPTERDPAAKTTSEIVVGGHAALGQAIAEIKARKAMTQAQIARRVGISPSVLSRLRTGGLKRCPEHAVQALLRLIPAGPKRDVVRDLFIRREVREMLIQMRRDRSAWTRHYLLASQGLDLRRRVKTDAPGLRLIPGDKSGSKDQWEKELGPLWRRAERLLARWFGVSPFQLLAEAHQDGESFAKSSGLLDYLKTPIGRIVSARWLRILDPLLVAPSSGDIDPAWTGLSDKELFDFVRFGLERELLLLARSPFFSSE